MSKTPSRTLVFAERAGSLLIAAGLGYMCLKNLHYATLMASGFIFVGAVAKVIVADVTRGSKARPEQHA